MNRAIRLRTAPRALRIIILAALGLLVLASCSTTSGGAYQSSAEGDSSAAAIAARRKRESPPSSPDDSSGGGGLLALFFARDDPPPPGGWIEVAGLPEGARLYVDGSSVRGPTVRADEGDREVRAEAFGYEPWSERVYVLRDQTIRLEAWMTPARFRFESLEAAPAAFDPEAPGTFGSTLLEWTAAAPGTAALSVLDESGRVIYESRGIAVDSTYGRARWNGSDGSGRPAPAGEYTVRMEGAGGDGTESSLEASVSLTPRSGSARYSSLHGGFSGALFAPDARVLPKGRFQASAGAYALSTPENSDGPARMPVFAGVRVGGLLRETSELAVSAMAVPYLGYTGYDPSWGSLALSLKTRILDGPTAAAFLLSASFASFLDPASSGTPPDWDGPARYPGLGAGLVLETASRYARAFASAQVMASTYYPGWADGRWETPGLFAWAYGRLGLEILVSGFLGGDLTAAVSAAARTEPFGTGAGFRPPLSAGAELHWYAPDSGLVLSAYAAGEWAGFTSWYWAGGLGIGFAL